MPFCYVNHLGRVYYLHLTRAHTGIQAGQPRYFFSRRAERALDHLPTGFVLAGEVPTTGVPVLRRVRERDDAPVGRSA